MKTSLEKLTKWTKKLEETNEQRRKQWIAALKACDGNITRAAQQMDPPFSRQRATVLTKQWDLIEFARGLRRKKS